MYQINFKNPCRIHFIGIGGISMSGLAQYLHNNGFKVTGSDSSNSLITAQLATLGIYIYNGQRSSNLTSDIDVVVYTAAIPSDNDELQTSQSLQIPLLSRAELVGQIMRNFSNPMAIAGTHGKTTATSMLSMILLEANLDPTLSVGGILDAIGGNIRIGKSEHFLTEACEYTNTFLHFQPKRSILLNIDEDHMDFFKDMEDIRNSFRRYIELHPVDGQIFIHGEIDDYRSLIEHAPCQVITYGVIDHHLRQTSKDITFDYEADDIHFDAKGCGQFDVKYKGKSLGRIILNVIGLYNITNALATIAMAHQMGIPFDTIQSALQNFHGANRRFQIKGEIAGITIVDDYAHHPTAVSATLTAAKHFPHNKLWCVFQPHTYTRLKKHLYQFASTLSLADAIIVADVYAAREPDPGDISSLDLVRELELLGKEVYHFDCFDDIENHLLQNCMNGDLLITMGAGDIVIVGESLLGQ